MTEAPPPYGQPYQYPPMPPRYDIGQAFGWAWAKFRANRATLVVGALVTLLAAIVMYALVVLIVLAVVPHPTLAIDSDPATTELDGIGRYFATLGVSYAAIFVLAIPFSVFSAGFIRTGLRIADGETPGIGAVFSYRNAPRIMLTSLILSLATLVGVILCYLPGLAFGLFAAFTLYFVLDHGQGPFAAIKSSFALTKNNFGNALVCLILAGLVGTAGVLVCLVGTLFTAPIAMLVHVYSYRFFSGGTIAP